MKTFEIHGIVGCSVRLVIKLSDEDMVGLDHDEIEAMAFEKADDAFGGVSGYAGNGGCNKLIGVCGSHESIEQHDGIDWTDCNEC